MKKLIAFLVALIFLHSSFLIRNCQSQWVQMSNGMGTDISVRSFAILGNNIFAGTELHGVYLSTNHGINWTQTALNNQSVYSLAVFGNNIFAGTNNYPSGPGNVYFSSDYGTNWISTTLNNQYVTALLIFENNIYAGTDGNGVYISTNSGTNWTQTALTNQYVWSFATLGNNIFAGTYGNGIYVSTNSGTTWTQTTLTNQYVNSIIANGTNIFAGTSNVSNVFGVFLSSNNGVNWSQTAYTNQFVWSLASIGNNIIAGTDEGVYLTTNNGTTWTQKNQGFNFVSSVYALIITSNFIYTGNWNGSVWRRSVSEILGIQNISTEIPRNFKLEQNYPNPFNPNTVISFQLPVDGLVSLKVYDLLGREAATLVNEKLAPGTYTVDWNASQYPSGVYFYSLTAGDYRETRRMTLVK